MINSLLTIIKLDLRLAYRQMRELLNPILFFVMVVSLFPLAISPEVKILKTIAPGVIWVAALLATLLSLERLFRDDYANGVIEQWALSSEPLSILISAKIFSHWLVTGLPLIIITPLLAMMLALSQQATIALLLTLLLGTPILSLLGAIGMALTVGLRGGGILLVLLVLPLYVPVLIFGAGSVVSAQMGMPYHGQLAILASMLVFAMMLSPLATAGALRIGIL